MKDRFLEIFTYLIMGICVTLLLGLIGLGTVWLQKTSVESTCNIKLTWKQAIFFSSSSGKCIVK